MPIRKDWLIGMAAELKMENLNGAFLQFYKYESMGSD